MATAVIKSKLISILLNFGGLFPHFVFQACSKEKTIYFRTTEFSKFLEARKRYNYHVSDDEMKKMSKDKWKYHKLSHIISINICIVHCANRLHLTSLNKIH